MIFKNFSSWILNNSISVRKSVTIRAFSYSNARAMRFVQYKSCGKRGLGILHNDDQQIISLSNADETIPGDMMSFLNGEYSIDNVKKIIAEKKSVLQSNEIEFLPCITKPDKIICVGLNYKGHCDEQKKPYPKEPFFFSKFPSTIIGPYDAIRHSSKTRALDFEVELAVVIGKICKNVNINDAYDYVFGYAVSQDITARDWQKSKNNGQWLIAKSMDTFCPIGLALVHKSEVPDPHNLQIKCSINGTIKQCASTNELIHRVDKLISFLSNLITLLPGDVILTGTPSGVGVFREPKEFLKPGDLIESEISSIGKMKNSIIADNI